MAPTQAPHVPEIIETGNVTQAHPSSPILDPVEPSGGPLDPLEIDPPDESYTFDIPAGTHPRDRSIAVDDLDRYSDNPSDHDTDNGQAFAVFERSSSDFNAGAVSITAANGGTSIVVGRVLGRKSVTIWVPTLWTNPAGVSAAPNGVLIGQTEGELQAGGGVQLNPGDSITIDTEAPIWAGLIPAKTSGVVQYLVTYNPAGGELSGQ